MFGLFKKKSEKQMLQEKYKALMEESYKLSTVDRMKSDEKRAEADEVAAAMDKLVE